MVQLVIESRWELKKRENKSPSASARPSVSDQVAKVPFMRQKEEEEKERDRDRERKEKERKRKKEKAALIAED